MAYTDPVTVSARNGGQVVLRCAQDQDAAELLHCAREIMAADVGNITTPEEFTINAEQEREWIRGFLDGSNALLLLAVADGAIVGNISFRPHERARLRHAGVLGMGVRPGWQGQGIGEALLRQLLHWARRNPQVESVHLQVLGNNRRALRLYYKCGFTVNGVKPRAVRYGDGSYTDEISMHLLL